MTYSKLLAPANPHLTPEALVGALDYYFDQYSDQVVRSLGMACLVASRTTQNRSELHAFIRSTETDAVVIESHFATHHEADAQPEDPDAACDHLYVGNMGLRYTQLSSGIEWPQIVPDVELLEKRVTPLDYDYGRMAERKKTVAERRRSSKAYAIGIGASLLPLERLAVHDGHQLQHPVLRDILGLENAD